ncbi:glycosyltransferase [Neokomagataea tanensis NBRC 106556]|uniref:Glycosyltransferase n=1 Tax=Neokomagataea tanensis NBRC 106556 TaxID=1223519 RepID=A0ABQ0QIP8_9PROT|nr:glycosyltransferase [Neokomagataea tanensis NBRC 106556]
MTAPIRCVSGLRHGRLPNGKKIQEYSSEFLSLKNRKKIDYIFGKIKKITNKKFHENKKIVDYFNYHENKNDIIYPLFLIIAELTVVQCAKYRVWQKKDLLERLGWHVEVIDWRDQAKVMSALQVCTRVIFYRVPGFDAVLAQVAEAHRLGLSPRWEVDDLIFDLHEYRQNGNVAGLPKAEQDLLFFGVGLFRKAMLACGRGLASTEALAQAMRDAGVQHVGIIENALDLDTLNIVQNLPQKGVREDHEAVWVCYGSGTNTHDADFRQAEQGLLAAMEQDERLCLRVVGPVQISQSFERFGARVERLPMRPYAEYLKILSWSDISIAPLQETLFNDCKSNIKFVEASIVGVASICSPRGPFCSVMVSGENGVLAATDEDWRQAFLRLTTDRGFRSVLAQKAKRDVLARYHPDEVAQHQVLPLYGAPVVSERQALRVLAVNVYYKPYSFGGATIVAEELVRGLSRRGVDVAVVTSRPEVAGRPPGALRYTVDDVPVLAVTIPEGHDRFGWIDNPSNEPHFSAWLEAFKPDVVHFHSVQGLGLSFLRVCEERGVPYVVTLHDAWWLCERQFMVKADGQYCFQTDIDLDVCRKCQSDTVYLADRKRMMMHALGQASLLLCPSEMQRQLYIANGIAPERLVVNRNGFAWPQRPRKMRRPGEGVRFAYVGGTEDIKGYKLLKKAAEGINGAGWSLTLVDNKRNLGYQSIRDDEWAVQGILKVVPGYAQSELDAFYDEVDVLLFPSQWKESYGLTVREALARDVWVVTTAPGGQSEDVVEGVNGTHLPIDGRFEPLLEVMCMLIAEPSRFDGYVNPLKNTLCTFDAQSDALLEHLTHIAGR